MPDMVMSRGHHDHLFFVEYPGSSGPEEFGDQMLSPNCLRESEYPTMVGPSSSFACTCSCQPRADEHDDCFACGRACTSWAASLV